ncbi:MAG: hypothetical protein ACREDE_08855 [Thermoplasmata archaeon]
MPWSQTRPLTCPKCGSAFDYEFIPGASMTAIRLGNSRYMRCPICRKFSVFKMTGPEAPLTPASVPPASGGPPSS